MLKKLLVGEYGSSLQDFNIRVGPSPLGTNWDFELIGT